MKLKHNKKNNPLFVFEVLLREYAKCSSEQNEQGGKEVRKTLKTFFSPKTEIYKELMVFRSLLESTNLEENVAQKILSEAKHVHSSLDKQKLMKEKHVLNLHLGKTFKRDIFGVFLPSYKNIATIYQIMNRNYNVKRNVLLEQQIVEHMKTKTLVNVEKIENGRTVLKAFSERFNKEYAGLGENQKRLIHTLVHSFENDRISLKVYINEELNNIKESLKEETLKTTNPLIREKYEQVLNMVNNFANAKVDNEMVLKVLKIQEVLNESKKEET